MQNRTILKLLILTIISSECKCIETWDCKTENIDEFSESLHEDIIGTWYEILRYPNEGKVKYVEVMVTSLPDDTDEDDHLLLKIKYKNEKMNTLKPNIRFPWDVWTNQGEFVLYNTPQTLDVKQIYKLIAVSDDKDYISACIYAPTTNTSEFKFLSRKPKRNVSMEKVLLRSLRLDFDIENSSDMTSWTYQGDRCKSSASTLTRTLTLNLLLLLIIEKIYTNLT